jgi:hypothetical protein
VSAPSNIQFNPVQSNLYELVVRRLDSHFSNERVPGVVMPRKTSPSTAPEKRDVSDTTDAFEKITGTRNRELQDSLLNQLLSTVPVDENASEKTKDDRLTSSFAALAGLAPRDEAEGMLAVQMVATHSAAMDCLRRARVSGQTFEARELNLKHAEKLMNIYTRQIEALDKRRGRGQQKITVEHVTVQAGGQAIVGSTVAGASRGETGASQSPTTLSALTDRSSESRPLIEGNLLGKRARKKSLAR